jgi:hypothetical protein
MPSAGILIVLTVLGTWACVKGRAAGPAANGLVLRRTSWLEAVDL